MSDDGGRVVHDSGGDRTVDDDGILLLLRHLILRPGTVSPPALARIVVSINIADDHVVLVVPVAVSPVSMAWVVAAIDIAHKSVVSVVPVTVSPVSMSWVIV